MAIYLKHRALAWESETDQIKALVEEAYNQEHGVDQSGDEGISEDEVDGANNTEIQELERQQGYVHPISLQRGITYHSQSCRQLREDYYGVCGGSQ